MLTRRQLLGVGAALPLLASRVSAHEGQGEEDEGAKRIEDAKTPADHAALAAHYRDRANKARADQAHHRLMAKAYSGKQGGVGAGRLHCQRLANEYGQMASEYDALAKLHDESAKSAQ